MGTWSRRLVRTVASTLAVALFMGLFATQTAEAASYKVSISVSKKSGLVTGDKITVTGTVSGKTTKRVVYLQYRYASGGKWKTLKKLKTTKAGKFTVTVKLTNDKDRKFRIYKPKEGSRKKAYSKTVTVKILPKVTTKTSTTAFTTATVKDMSMSMCSADVVRTQGVAGKTVTYYRDGKKWKTVKTAPVTQVVAQGASPAPCSTQVAPASVPAATGGEVTVTGKNLAGATVKVSDVAAAVVSSSATQLVFTAPPAAEGGAAPIEITTANGTATVAGLSYLAPPAITGMSSDSGPMAGGQTIRITGSGLSGTTSVTFTPLDVNPAWTTSGDDSMPAVPALGFVAGSDTTLEVVVPPGLAGANQVLVSGPTGSATATYSYVLTSRDPSEAELAFVARVNEYRAEGYACDGVTGTVAGPLQWAGLQADVGAAQAIDLATRWPEHEALPDIHQYPGITEAKYRVAATGFRTSYAEVAIADREWRLSGITAQPVTVDDAVRWADQFVQHSYSHCKALMTPGYTKIGAGMASANASPRTAIMSVVAILTA